jgi:transcription-repair coupling factor (superfamily II helicase)
VKEIQIDTDFEILFPDEYINIISERLSLYNQLSTLKTEEELLTFEAELTDRFGELPIQVTDLLNSVRIKWIAKHLGIERLILKQSKMICYFVSDQQSSYYQTPIFTKVLHFVQHNAKICTMKEKETKSGLRLLLTFEKITSIDKALTMLQNI